MEIERLVRRTAVGGFIVAGGVVLSQTGASATEAPAGSSGSAAPAPLKKRAIAASAPTSNAATAAAPTSAKVAKAATATKASKAQTKGPAKAAAKAAAATEQPSTKAGLLKASRASKATTTRAATAVAPTLDVAVLPGPTAALEPAAVLDTVSVPPLGSPTTPSTPIAPAHETPAPELTLVTPPAAAEPATAQETGLGQPVAAGPPPADLVSGGSALANEAFVTAGARAFSAAVTGTSANGLITITIDEPRPGTVVAPGQPVLVTGTVSIGGGPTTVNVVYVLDVSGSTSAPGGACGDPNGDASANTILDCEIAGLTALNTSLGSANISVGLVTFSSGGTTEDVSPAPGLQTTTQPTTDVSGNGVPDIVDVLRAQVPGGGTDFDAALAEVQGLLVPGARNFVFFLSDGQSSLATGPGSPLEAIANAGATVLTFAVGTGTTGCATGEPLNTIAVTTGGSCTEVTDPAQLAAAITGGPGFGQVDGIEVVVNGVVLIPSLDPSGRFSVVIPADVLRLGRNDIVANAFSAGQVATADTFVLVGVGPGGGVAGDDEDDDDDFDRDFLLVDLDVDSRTVEAASFGDVTGLLPVTGTGAGHLAATGALSFLLGGMFIGGGRHLRRRRRAGAPA